MLWCHQDVGNYTEFQRLTEYPAISVMTTSHHQSSRASSARRLTVTFTWRPTWGMQNCRDTGWRIQPRSPPVTSAETTTSHWQCSARMIAHLCVWNVLRGTTNTTKSSPWRKRAIELRWRCFYFIHLLKAYNNFFFYLLSSCKNMKIKMSVDVFQTNVRETNAQIQQMIQARLRKMEEITNSVDLSKVSFALLYGCILKEMSGLTLFSKFMFWHPNQQKITQRETERSSQVCTLLITTITRHQAGLVEELEQRQEETEKRAEELLDELKQEINELQTRNSELQHLELAQNPLHVLQVRSAHWILTFLCFVKISRTVLMRNF